MSVAPDPPPTAQRTWESIAPADAVGLDLSEDFTVTAPLNEIGERCPWPWEPQQLGGVPLGQYHCPYCLAMVVAGMPHLDYSDQDDEPAPEHSPRS